MATSTEPKHIIVLGAGVIGLQTALSLLTSPLTSHLKVTIIASILPSSPEIEILSFNNLSRQYSSHVADGIWHSRATLADEDAEIREWDERTYRYWSQLLEGDGDGDGNETYEDRVKKMGLAFKEHRYYWAKETPEIKGHDGSGLWFKDLVRDFEILDLKKGGMKWGESLPQSDEEAKPGPGAIFGVKYRTICINPVVYLRCLLQKVKELGAEVIEASVDVFNGLEGVVKDAKAILERERGVKESNVLALINCTGCGAKGFIGKEESEKIILNLGESLCIEGETEMAHTFVGFAKNSESAYAIPRPGSGMTILGGCELNMAVDDWDQNVAGNIRETIHQRIRIWGVAEKLRVNPDNEPRIFKMKGWLLGFRPDRVGGPRVAVEGKEPVAGTWVVHAYGHVAGFQNSVGSAETVVKLVSEL